MILDEKRLTRFVGAVAASLAMVELGWNRAGSFFGLAIASMFGTWAIAWSLKLDTSDQWPKPAFYPVNPTTEKYIPPSLAGFIGTFLGFSLLAGAWMLALKNQLLGSLLCVVAGALVWRPLINLRQEAGLSRRWVAILMLMAMAAGAAFRFTKAGEIPAGMITVDEPRLMEMGRQVAEGKRSSFIMEGSEGNVPLWVEGAALWLFGKDITGFRMSALLPGFIVVGLIALLALELAGTRVGLMAAGFAALCVWPVSFSRAEYLVCSSLVPIIAAPWLLMRGLRSGSPLALAASGFFLGLCFNIYSPGRLVPLLMLVLVWFLWLRLPQWRKPILWAILPVLGGCIVGLAPLLLWAARDPATAYAAYFGKLNYGLIAGDGVAQAHGLLTKFDMTFGRILPNLPHLFTMFTTHGGMRPWYFNFDEPVIDQGTLFLVLVGIATCFVRFRQPGFAFILVWWLLGLTPTLLADPAYHMDERRIMLNMPATMIIAAIGLHNSLSLLTQGLNWKRRNIFFLILSLTFFTILGVNCWNTYFVDINMNREYQDYNHANFDNMLRAIFRENHKAPVTVLSFRKPNDDNWWGSNPENELQEHFNVLGTIPHQIASEYEAYFNGDGLFGWLRSLPDDGPDPLIVLTPFHFYLEPLLVNELGGEEVANVPPVMAKDGLNFKDIGFAWDKTTATRLIRLKDFHASKVDALVQRWSFPYTVEELKPPVSVGTRESLSQLWLLDPKHIQALKSYSDTPQRWQTGMHVNFALPDAWFWITDNNFPGKPQMPLSLKASWILNIPADGEYSLGASSNLYIALRVDGKRVFTYLPETREQAELGRDGSLGVPVFLKAGPHHLDIDQVALSGNGNFDHLIRLLWQKPGGDKETLPIEVLMPTEKTTHR